MENSLACATICGSDPTCTAASWFAAGNYLSLGNCFLVKGNFNPVVNGDYMMLSKYTPDDGYSEPPVGGSGSENEDKLCKELDEQCTSDKAELAAKEEACIKEKEDIAGVARSSAERPRENVMRIKRSLF